MATMLLKPATPVTMGSPPLFLPPVLREPEKAKAREFVWCLLLGGVCVVPSAG